MERSPRGTSGRTAISIPSRARGSLFQTGVLFAPCGILILLQACSSPQDLGGQEVELARRIGKILARPELRGTTVGIEIRRLGNGELLYEHDAEKLLPPASTAKIVSCAGALALLGEDFRFETRIVGTGELKDGLLRGDLVMVASGDPNLSQRVTPDGKLLYVDNDHTYAGFLRNAAVVPGDPLLVLGKLATQVKAAGVKRVEGAVVVDEGIFHRLGDEVLANLSGACVNDNVLDVLVIPAPDAGKPPTLQVLPSHPLFSVENRVQTVSSNAGNGEPSLNIKHRGGAGRFELVGTIPVGSRPILCVARLPDPALAAAHFLSGELSKQGIAVGDPPRKAARGPAAYAHLPVLARHISPPLSEAVQVILKVSHNLHAEMLPHTIGALRGSGGDRQAGFRLIHDLLKREGIESDGVLLQSGSGLGRADRLSARFLVRLLEKIAAWKEGQAFYSALPMGGVDGTLASRFTRPHFRGRLRAKTGTLLYPGSLNSGMLYLSKALAGYLDLGDIPPEPPDPSVPQKPGRDTAVFAILMANTYTRDRLDGADLLFQAQEDILASVMEVYGNSEGR